ncbi:DUF2591 domain-containing protein [Tatumella sp. TA1]|nr:DUF2591 domain-containing protein [Tatumella sp. TA1]
MNYQEMTDFEINKAVAIALGHKCYYENGSFTNGRMGSSVVVKGNGIVGSVNFCKSWADAGQIAQENKISVLFDEQGMCHAAHEACWVDGVEWQIDGIVDENPCRAICIVFLMMKGGE